MAYFAVQYTYAGGSDAELDKVRPEHRAFLTLLTESTLVASGPYVDADQPSALLILRADNAAEVEQTLDEDPFHKAGLITERRVEEWNPLIGVFAN